jgi:hypothetical protein
MVSASELMDCFVTVFVDEFSNFFNIFCRFAGAWSSLTLDQPWNVNAIQKPLPGLNNVLQEPHEVFKEFR